MVCKKNKWFSTVASGLLSKAARVVDSIRALMPCRGGVAFDHYLASGGVLESADSRDPQVMDWVNGQGIRV